MRTGVHAYASVSAGGGARERVKGCMGRGVRHVGIALWLLTYGWILMLQQCRFWILMFQQCRFCDVEGLVRCRLPPQRPKRVPETPAALLPAGQAVTPQPDSDAPAQPAKRKYVKSGKYSKKVRLYSLPSLALIFSCYISPPSIYPHSSPTRDDGAGAKLWPVNHSCVTSELLLGSVHLQCLIKMVELIIVVLSVLAAPFCLVCMM